MWPARSGSNRWPPVLQTGTLHFLSYSPNSGPGRSRTDRLRIASAVLSRTELQAQIPVDMRRPGIQFRSDRRQLVRTSDADRLIRTNSISPASKERARIGAQQIESNESSPYLRHSADANNVGASVPPLRAGHGEMEVRVDCGNADPPCVSALLCRCSRAEHRIGARQWVKESNLRVSPGSHQKCRCD